ncbi:MAG: phage/plasmid primase, P4 family [Methanoregula sp.]|jgi:putative DNA primase/helicase|nr:phage/plasmid primase, P4 family [Methanoregula sp.]
MIDPLTDTPTPKKIETVPSKQYTAEQRKNIIDSLLNEKPDPDNTDVKWATYYRRFLNGELSDEQLSAAHGDWFKALKEKDRKKKGTVIDDEGSSLRRNEIACINNRPRTDVGNAERLVDQYGIHLKYCHHFNSWYVWTPQEGRWRKDDLEQIYRAAKDVIRRIGIEASRGVTKTSGDDLYKWAMTCECRAHITGMVDIAKSDLKVAALPEIWDTNDFSINLLNGTFDLKTFELKNHYIKDYNSKIAPIEYDCNAVCPNWLKFLERIMRSREDKTEIISFLQRAIGYTLTGSTKEQAMFLLWGSGANGKSVLIDVIRTMMGEYGITTDSSTFVTSRGGAEGGRARGDIARLAGARMVSSSENSPDSRLDEQLIKNLTGSDKVTARFLYQEAFEFYPKFKIWWAFNHQPQIYDTTNSIWRRIKLIPFEETIPDDEQDPFLADKLKQEIPGIFNWAVEGLKQYYETGGLGAPAAVSKATKEYREDQDILHEFIAESCEFVKENDPFGRVFDIRAKDLYEAYKSWNSWNGDEKPMSNMKFGNLLKDRGLKKERKTDGIHYLGVRLLQAVKREKE